VASERGAGIPGPSKADGQFAAKREGQSSPMSASKKNRVILFSSLTIVAGVSVATCPAALNVSRDVGIDQRLDAQLPLDLSFRDENGTPVRLRDYFDTRPVILVLAYYRCPMLCTQVLNGLVKSMRDIDLELGTQYRVLTVSFDPREGPELAAQKKATYSASYARAGAADGWHFLTGAPDEIAKLASVVGFRYVYDSEHDQFAHGSAIMILTPQGHISHYFMGIDFPSRDVRLALVEASQRRIGSSVDRLLLLCYHFDPLTGRYSASAISFVRIVSAAMLLLVGVPIARSWYREWSRGREIVSTQ
jgi:protein SCO1/2